MRAAACASVTYEGYEVSARSAVPPGHLRELGLRELKAAAYPGSVWEPARSYLTAATALSGGTVLNLHLVLTQAFGQAVLKLF